MIRKMFWLIILVGLVFASSLIANASQLVESKLDTKLVPSPVEYNVLLPDGYEAAKEPLPLLLFLHGGGVIEAFLQECARPSTTCGKRARCQKW